MMATPGIKSKLVIFEGCDKTGKDTLYREYRKATVWGPLCIVRFIGSNLVHDNRYNRDDRKLKNVDLFGSEMYLQDLYDIYLIVLTGDTDVLAKRIQQFDPEEDKEKALANISEIDKLFRTYYEASFIKKKLLLDTTKFGIMDCLDKILEFTGEKRREEDWKAVLSK
jgi:thymidylate kinase